MKLKRIGIVIDTLNGGGAEKVCISLAQALNQQGHKADLIVLKKKCDYQVPSNISVHFVYSESDIKLNQSKIKKAAAKRLSDLIAHLEADGDFDLLLSNLDDCHPVVALADLPRTKYVVHNSIEQILARTKRLGPLKYWKKLSAVKVLNGKELITVSKGLAREIEDAGRIKPKSITPIYNPVDLDLVRSNAQVPMPEAEYDFPYVLHIGRFAKQKRHDVLFAALSQVPEPYKLVLLSNASSKLKKAIAKTGLAHRIHVVDFQQNPYPWVRNAKALVLSSDFEGLGMVLIEALACGTPVVSTDCPHGPNEILTADLAQYLSPVGDAQALAKNINKVLLEPPEITNPDILQKVEAEHVARQYIALTG